MPDMLKLRWVILLNIKRAIYVWQGSQVVDTPLILMYLYVVFDTASYRFLIG